jgi:chromosome segregation ATPase
MKNELLESNAIKDNYIDTLNRKIFALNKDLNKREESLQETSFNLDFEKQRLTNALKSKDKTIRVLNTQIEELKTEVYNSNTVVNQKNYEVGKLKDKMQVQKNSIDANADKIAALQLQLHKAQADTKKALSQKKEKDATIMRLENNVKLLKKELGK